MKRTTIITISLAGAIVAISSLGLLAFLSSWIPTKGKAKLIQLLEDNRPIAVSISDVRYEFFMGFVLNGVEVTQRDSKKLLLSMPNAQIQIGWFSLFLQRQIVLRAKCLLESPCRTQLLLSGRYKIPSKYLLADARAKDIVIETISEPIMRYIPRELKSGNISFAIRVIQKGASPASVSGRATLRNFKWADETLRAAGDLTASGNATAPLESSSSWNIDAQLNLRSGSIEGITALKNISDIEAKAHLTTVKLEIESLSAVALGSRWTAEGTINLSKPPSIEAMLKSSVETASLVEEFPMLKTMWKADGNLDVRAVCRGLVIPKSQLDCLIESDVKGLTLSGPKLKEPLKNITGHLFYDMVPKELSIDRLQGQLLNESLSAAGRITISEIPVLAVEINGNLPLSALMGYLPAENHVNRIDGIASTALRMQGPLNALRYVGEVKLRDASAELSKPALSLKQVQGSILFAEDHIETDRLVLNLNKEPIALKATLNLDEVLHLIATIDFSHGKLSLSGRMSPQDIIIDMGRLSLNQTVIDVSGSVSKNDDHPSRLRFLADIELGELAHVPFLSVPQLDAWQLKGLIKIRGDLQGQLSDLTSTTITSDMRADYISMKGIPIEQLSCVFEQRNGTLHAKIPSAMFADGKFWAELAVVHHAKTRDYALQADAVGLQLSRLAEIIPAWRSQATSGIASTHLSIAGTWEDKNSYHGEGWINAQGERLGDIPLLEKVFQGLFGALANRIGLDSLRRAQITQASVQWNLSQGRFYTDNLRLGGISGTEPVAIYAKGSVGLDKTLDFVIEPELSEGVVLESPTTSTLANTILKAAGQLERLRRLIGRHRLSGTLENPEYHFELGTQEITKQLSPASTTDLLKNILDSVR